jgi:hypothetical protein
MTSLTKTLGGVSQRNIWASLKRSGCPPDQALRQKITINIKLCGRKGPADKFGVLIMVGFHITPDLKGKISASGTRFDEPRFNEARTWGRGLRRM